MNKTSKTLKFLYDLEKAIEHAKAKHPDFPKDPVKACALLAEESGEAIREANHIDEGKDALEAMKHEVMQAAAVCYRIIEEFRDE